MVTARPDLRQGHAATRRLRQSILLETNKTASCDQRLNIGTRTGSLKQWVKLALQTRKHMNPQLEAFFPIAFAGAF